MTLRLVRIYGRVLGSAYRSRYLLYSHEGPRLGRALAMPWAASDFNDITEAYTVPSSWLGNRPG